MYNIMDISMIWFDIYILGNFSILNLLSTNMFIATFVQVNWKVKASSNLC